MINKCIILLFIFIYIVKINNKKKKYIYTELQGGLCNQLFMFFNLLAFSKKHNRNFKLTYNKDYKSQYYKENGVIRNDSTSYSFFKNIYFDDIKTDNDSLHCTLNEKEFRYNDLDKPYKQKNTFIQGYFQSYKYFWSFKDSIKEKLHINRELVNSIKNKYKGFKKKIISIHIRLGDYIQHQDVHCITPIEYYKKVLSYYNINDYQIILFSDDIEMAKKRFHNLNIRFINAYDLSKEFLGFNMNEEEIQLYMLMLSNIIIGANSSYSLMSCYLNEMYSFNNDSVYFLPKKWFGPKGPTFIEEDIKINYKFNFIDYENVKSEIENEKIKKYLKTNISILIPIYNGIEYLEECLDSIKCQTFKNFEILIGINGWKLNSLCFKKCVNIINLNKFINLDIKLYDFGIIKKKNPKSTTLNLLKNKSSYDYLSLMDVDDKWLPNKLEKQIDYIDLYDVIGTKCIYFGDSNIIPLIPSCDLEKNDFKKSNPIINSSVLLKKNLAKWNENTILEDYFLWLSLKKKQHKFFNINEILVYHRIHKSSFYNSQKGKEQKDELKILLQKF